MACAVKKHLIKIAFEFWSEGQEPQWELIFVATVSSRFDEGTAHNVRTTTVDDSCRFDERVEFATEARSL